MDSLLLEVVESIDDFDLRPTQSVQLGDTEQVSFAEHRETGTELVSLVQGRGAGDLLKEHLFASICFQVIHLGVGALVSGGAPCVSDFACHVPETRTFLEHSTRTLFPNDFDSKDPSPHVCSFSSKDLKSFRTAPEHQSLARTNTHVLVEGDHGRWMVEEPIRRMDLQVPQG